jgi:hypothetical protein
VAQGVGPEFKPANNQTNKKTLMLSKMRESQKATYYTVPFTCSVARTETSIEARRR